MISRRTAIAALCAAIPGHAQKTSKPAFGLQTYSLRYDLEKDFPGTLALIRRMGFEELEVSNWPGHSAAEYRRLLDDNGLKAVSMMASYQRLDKEVQAAAEDARQLGAGYVVCSTLPQKNYMTDEECRHAAEFLNSRGESLAAAKLGCCYHLHGTEFHPSREAAALPATKSASAKTAPAVTVFDTLLKRTEARFANFEMDIFWVVYAGQDPVKLLHRYPGRFPLTHVKDIRPGTVLGGLPRDVLEEESVPLGTGLVDIPAALKAAQQTGVKHHFIEDEAVDAAQQIPKSLRFLETIAW
jgi:sugar phosphate isomerase/epimerase